MDPVTVLGVTASLIACLQLTGTLLKRFGPSDHSKTDLNRILKTIQDFQDSCNDLKSRLDADPENEVRFSSYRYLDEPLRLCEQALNFLCERLEGLNFIRQHIVGSSWDLKLKKCLQRLDEAKDLLKLALCRDDSVVLSAVERYIRNVAEDVRDLKTVIDENGKRLLDNKDLINEYGRYLLDLGEDVREIKAQYEQSRREEDQKLRDEIFRWLCTTDPYIDHNAACAKCKPGTKTGTWFIHGEEYRQWKEQPSSFLWLHSIPGGGKTILCSTIIQDMLNFCDSQPSPENMSAAFFYCSFTDSKKQRVFNLIRSFLHQLVQRLPRVPSSLTDFYNQHKHIQPRIDNLKMTLRSVIDKSEQSFLIIDALDECVDENGTRSEILTFLTELSDWNMPQLHILVTSRKEPEIEQSLSSLKRLNSICIQTEQQQDIEEYVTSVLKTDSHWTKWSFEVKREIQDALIKNSAGMFRWVFCQLKILQKCRRVKDVRQSLKSLPKDLDETYARILLSIDESDRQVALTALQWLAFSKQPLSIQELAEAAVVDPQSETPLDPDDQFPDSNEILAVLPGLVTESEYSVKLAHFSVKEYLVSERIRDGDASEYSIREIEAHTTIANVCLVYLSQFNTADALVSLDTLDGFPLLKYAAEYWFEHAQVIEESCKKSLPLSDKLFYYQKEACINWASLYDLVNKRDGFFSGYRSNWQVFKRGYLVKNRNQYFHALHYASAAGLPMSVQFLLENGANINAQSSHNQTALQLASCYGHETLVRSLLDHEADVNAQGGEYENALQAACLNKNEMIIRLLLDHEADVNAQGGKYGNALQAACLNENEMIKRLLLDHEADVNAQGGAFRNALQAACLNENEMIIRLLLDHEADVNAQGGKYGNALQAACLSKNEMIIRLLLDHKADVNAQGGYYGNALQAACYRGNEMIIRLLFDHEADVNAQGGYYGNALQAACYRGNEMMTRLLLDHGADVNAQGGYYGNALQAACTKNNEMIIRLLLDHGADVNAQGGEYENALQTACYWGHEMVVQLLLDRGANVNNHEGGVSSKSLKTAARAGYKTIERLLLDHGARYADDSDHDEGNT